jgi:hypothetical protein
MGGGGVRGGGGYLGIEIMRESPDANAASGAPAPRGLCQAILLANLHRVACFVLLNLELEEFVNCGEGLAILG